MVKIQYQVYNNGKRRTRMKFGKILKKLPELNNMTQKQLANALDLSPPPLETIYREPASLISEP